MRGDRQTEVEQESHAVARKPRDATAVILGLTFADDTHYKLAKLRKLDFRAPKTYRRKTVFNEKWHARSFKVMCFGISGKAIRHQVILYNKVGLIY